MTTLRRNLTIGLLLIVIISFLQPFINPVEEIQFDESDQLVHINDTDNLEYSDFISGQVDNTLYFVGILDGTVEQGIYVKSQLLVQQAGKLGNSSYLPGISTLHSIVSLNLEPVLLMTYFFASELELSIIKYTSDADLSSPFSNLTTSDVDLYSIRSISYDDDLIVTLSVRYHNNTRATYVWWPTTSIVKIFSDVFLEQAAYDKIYHRLVALTLDRESQRDGFDLYTLDLDDPSQAYLKLSYRVDGFTTSIHPKSLSYNQGLLIVVYSNMILNQHSANIFIFNNNPIEFRLVADLQLDMDQLIDQSNTTSFAIHQVIGLEHVSIDRSSFMLVGRRSKQSSTGIIESVNFITEVDIIINSGGIASSSRYFYTDLRDFGWANQLTYNPFEDAIVIHRSLTIDQMTNHKFVELRFVNQHSASNPVSPDPFSMAVFNSVMVLSGGGLIGVVILRSNSGSVRDRAVSRLRLNQFVRIIKSKLGR